MHELVIMLQWVLLIIAGGVIVHLLDLLGAERKLNKKLDELKKILAESEKCVDNNEEV